jgi:hypothetical protein
LAGGLLIDWQLEEVNHVVIQGFVLNNLTKFEQNIESTRALKLLIFYLVLCQVISVGLDLIVVWDLSRRKFMNLAS